MPAPPKARLHVVLPSTEGAEPWLVELAAGLRPFHKPETDSYVVEFDGRGARDEYRDQLLERGVLCSTAPIPPGLRERWQRYLAGGSPFGFSFLALLFSPAWLLYSGLVQKFFLWLGLWAGLSGAANVPFKQPIRGVLALAAAIGHLALWLYPSLLGGHDVYLQRVRREPLWPFLPYARLWPLAWAVSVGGVLVGLGLKIDYKAKGEYGWTIPAGGKEAALATLQVEANTPLALELAIGDATVAVKSWSLMWSKTPRQVLDRLDLGGGRASSLPPLSGSPGAAGPVLSCLGDLSLLAGDETQLLVPFGNATFTTTLPGWRKVCILANPQETTPSPLALIWLPRDAGQQGPNLDAATAASRAMLGALGTADAGLFTGRTAAVGASKVAMRRYLVVPIADKSFILGDYYMIESPGRPPVAFGIVYPPNMGQYVNLALIPAVVAAQTAVP